MSRRQRLIFTGGIALWAIVACFNRLGEAPVYIANEAREGVYVRAMLNSGNFLAPMVANHLENGEVVPDKPPLFHWIAAAATWLRASWQAGASLDGAALAGTFDEWTLRFPSALCAAVMVVAVAWLGGDLVGARAALLAAAALLTMPQFSFQARLGRVDMTFACCVTIAVLLAARAILGGRPRELPLAAGVAGLAVLAKGPLGAGLPILACGTFLGLAAAREGGSPRLTLLPWRTALVALLVVALPWYLAANVATGGAVLRSQLFAENLDQFTGGNGRMRLLFYLEPWLLDSLPWNLVAVAALVSVWKRREAGPAFCAIWWLAILAFFEIAAYKRRAYLLPALPAEALLAGWFLDAKLFAAGDLRFAPQPKVLARGVASAMLVCGLGVVAGALLVPLVEKSRLAAAGLSPLDVAVGLGGVAAVGLALAAALRSLQTAELWRALTALFVALGSFYAAIFPAGLAVKARQVSAKSLVTRIDAALPAGSPLEVCGVGEDQSLILLFYFSDPQRVDVRRDDWLCLRDPQPGFYLLRARDWDAIGHRTDDDRFEWREILTGELKRSSRRSRVVFAERRLIDRSGR